MAKKRWWFEESEQAEDNGDVEYAACLFCGSKEYDMSNGDLHQIEYEFQGKKIEVTRYIPTSCDQCAFGWTQGETHMPIH
jgi:hypothetical protein